MQRTTGVRGPRLPHRDRLRTHVTGACVLALGAVLATAGSSLAAFEGFDLADDGVDGRLTDSPVVSAYEIQSGESIDIDGRLDDPVWLRASAAGGFRQWNPDRGGNASQETRFKIAFDGGALYIGVACYESDVSEITKTLSRRDRFNSSDVVTIYLDPYSDKTSGYGFSVNPVGVQQDEILFDDGDSDTDWNAVWEAETYTDADGWYAEFRIPLSSIRYRPGIDRWGLQVWRSMHSRGEEASWAVWDRDLSGFVSRFGSLEGVPELDAPRQLELLPYTVARATDPSVIGEEEMHDFENFGLDAKYGVTADLTLNATFQPDFGQVEADPAELNLSPFETFFQEKRPFFVEGSRFFQHPDFNLFYSRRIGTGDENARIRYAAKLTGKTGSGTSVGVLAAASDITEEGKHHNFLKDGEQHSTYLIGRVGQEFDEGNLRFNLMQTAVINSTDRWNTGSSADFASREAYTTGADFSWRFADRKYRVAGSFVGNIIDPESVSDDPDFEPSKQYGTGGEFDFNRNGKLDFSTWVRWESDDLQLNDVGFLSAPDAIDYGLWMGYDLAPDSEGSFLNRGNVNLNAWKNWYYGERTGYDLHTGEQVWHYSKGHRSFSGGNLNGWMQFRNHSEFWWGASFNADGTQRYHTRSSVELLDGSDEPSGSFASIPGGGPMISEPETYGFWGGAATDTRKSLWGQTEFSHYWDTADNLSTYNGVGLYWDQSPSIDHEVWLGYNWREDDTQHLDNFENPGGGIGGVSYVFGRIKQRTIDLTLRTNVLFSRNQSLELYAQPFITVGDYSEARELQTPDTYDLVPFERDWYDVDDEDFSFSAVNLNAVYRWEYRPGSTLYLVWAHSRSEYDQRAFYADADRQQFDNDLSGEALFSNEPENVFLVKVSYWLPI